MRYSLYRRMAQSIIRLVDSAARSSIVRPESQEPASLPVRGLRETLEHTRVASVRAGMEELVKLFKKAKSQFNWFDFTVRGHRYRGSTGETKTVRATKVASMKLAQAR